jgi:uncharacterized protein (TIGR03437 family)
MESDLFSSSRPSGGSICPTMQVIRHRYSQPNLLALLLVVMALGLHAQPVSVSQKAIQRTLAGAAAAATPEPPVQVAELSGASTSTCFGCSVAIDGPVAVVGAPGKIFRDFIRDFGRAFIFVQTGNTWNLQASIQAPDSSSEFGASVAVSGGTVFVGSSGAAGAVFVYTQAGGTWNQQDKLTAGDGTPGDFFGTAVAVDGGNLVVGAPGKNNGQGATYVFAQTENAWVQQAELTAPDGSKSDSFGTAVTVSRGTAVVGANFRGRGFGAAYVYTGSAGQWSLEAELTPSDAVLGDQFGNAVALTGDTLAVAAYGKNTYRGAAYVFTRTAHAWSQQTELVAADGASEDFFGGSVALSGGTVAVGAYLNQHVGAVYLFAQASGGWSQQAKVVPSDAVPVLGFGGSVPLEGNTLFAGGGFPGASGIGNGAAYLFRIPAGPSALSAASFASGPIAPGEIIALLTDLGPDVGVSASPSAEGLLPTQLAGLQVFFDGVAAPILYAQKQQVNVQAPFELANPATPVHIEYNGVATWPTTLAVQAAAPAIFPPDVSGQSSQALVVNQDGTMNSASNPAPRGSIVALWGTGGGVTIPSSITGGFTPLESRAPLALPASIALGSAAIGIRVTYSGVSPTLSSGIFQVNFEIPADAPLGPYVPLSLAIGSVKSTDPQVGTTIAIK